jgi:hypothetical protein
MATKKKPERIPVSSAALIKRVNRLLESEGLTLKRSHTLHPAPGTTPGLYFIVSRTGIESRNLNLEELARSKGVLKAWEILKKS